MYCLLPPVCIFCEHFLGEERNAKRDCLAFVEIPKVIMEGENDHFDAVRGDHGYRFSLRDADYDIFMEINRVRSELGLKVFRSEAFEG